MVFHQKVNEPRGTKSINSVHLYHHGAMIHCVSAIQVQLFKWDSILVCPFFHVTMHTTYVLWRATVKIWKSNYSEAVATRRIGLMICPTNWQHWHSYTGGSFSGLSLSTVRCNYIAHINSRLVFTKGPFFYLIPDKPSIPCDRSSSQFKPKRGPSLSLLSGT